MHGISAARSGRACKAVTATTGMPKARIVTGSDAHSRRTWRQRVSAGFFSRAEALFDCAARQLALLRVLHDLTKTRIAQLVVATHLPMLMPFPGATLVAVCATAEARLGDSVPPRPDERAHTTILAVRSTNHHAATTPTP